MKILKRPLGLARRMFWQHTRVKILYVENEKLEAKVQELQESVVRLHDERKRIFDENLQLQERVKDLARQCNDADGRAAALNYRAFELSKGNERLEMILTGTRAQRDEFERFVNRLKTEIQRLKDELAAYQSRQKEVP